MFSHYSTSNGLSSGAIGAIIRDHEGYIWVGTWDGLNRFDGHNFTTFKSKPGDSNILSSNRIVFLMEDSWGFIWIKTYDQKVFRFDRRTEQFEIITYDDQKQKSIPVKADQIKQFSNGDIWLTSPTVGVFRIVTDESDYSFTIEPHLSSDSVATSSTHLSSFIFEDAQKYVWFESDKGLECLHPNSKNNGFVPADSSFLNLNLMKQQLYTCFLELPDFILFGTKEGKLIKFDQKKKEFRDYFTENKSSISSLSISGRQNLIYIGTSGSGMLEFDCRNFEIQKQVIDPLIKNIQSIYVDNQQMVWLDTDQTGVIKYDPFSEKLKQFTQRSEFAEITSRPYTFFQDEKGILWINMGGNGFGYYNRQKDTFNYFFNDPGDKYAKLSNNVSYFLEAPEGVIWISNYIRGLHKITILDGDFRHDSITNAGINPLDGQVRCFFEDRMKNLWISTRGGILQLFDKKNRLIRSFTSANSSLKDPVYCIAEDKDGTLYFGTKGSGIYVLDRLQANSGKFDFIGYRHSTRDKNSLSHDYVFSMLCDRNGRLWIGTYGGGLDLMVRKNNQIEFVNQNNLLHSYPKEIGLKIRHLQQDSYGNIWIATTDGLLYFNSNEIDPGHFQFNHLCKVPGDINSMGNNDAHFIYRDKFDTLWIATLGGGLNKLITYPEDNKPARFRNYSKENGLPSDLVLSVTGDENGNLWIGTENGLSNFVRKKGVFKNYDEYDGIQITQFVEASCLRRSDGTMLFGSIEGYYSFNPDHIKATQSSVTLVFNNFKIYDKELKPGTKDSPLKYSVNETKTIDLKYDQNVFSIEYAALDFKAPHKIKYAYLLEGFDDQWHNVTNQRIASYIKVPPGNYTFKLRILDDDMEKFFAEKKLHINISQPPWKTRWAYSIYLIFLLLILEIVRRVATTMIKLRNKVIIEQKINELKLNFFTNISHELRTPLTLIVGPLSDLSKNEQLSRKGIQSLQIIDKNAKRMLRLINQILDFRKVQNKKMKLHISEVEVVSFIRGISSHFTELAKEKKIDFKFHPNVDELKVCIDEEKIDIVIFNLLSNAFKFTENGKSISISLIYNSEKNIFTISVADQGLGIPEEKINLLFDRFTTFEHHQISFGNSSGIGLALSKELVDLHHGQISVNSQSGVGTTFSVELKLGNSHFSTDEIDFASGSNQYKPLVVISENEPIIYTENINSEKPEDDAPLLLLVEDNPELLNYLQNLFAENYRIITAMDGAEGLVKSQENAPDLIVSDIMMPKMNGIEMLDKLRNDFQTSHIPIILLSAKSSIESQLQGIKYGADAYITKPFNPDVLQAQIDNLIRQRKRLTEHLGVEKRIISITPHEVVITSKDEAFLEKVMEIIEENISNTDFNIDQIASFACLGRSTFFKKVKGLTGMSPVELVREMRIKRAHQLLISGEYSISEIAFQTGFNSAAYFSTSFKEKYNQTPSQYLSSLNNQ